MSFRVSDILSWTSGRLANSPAGVENIRVEKPAPLGNSTEIDVAFFFSKVYQNDLMTANPGILVIGEPFLKPIEAAKLPCWGKAAIVVCQDPYLAMAIISEKFANKCADKYTNKHDAKIHPSAIISSSAVIGGNVRVGPNCVIEDRAKIGAGSILHSGCTIGQNCSIGSDCVLFPGVTLYENTQVGDRARIHAGSVLGSDGFGYAPIREGRRVVGHQKIYHLGRVIVGDDVEIGANSCVDRGTFGETWIGNSVKLDNLVHIGHNSRVDHGAIICGGTCLAGNASVGKFATIGGLSGVANHVHVGDGASVGALSLVTKDVPVDGTAVGNPQRDYREHFGAHALLSRLLVDRKQKRRMPAIGEQK